MGSTRCEHYIRGYSQICGDIGKNTRHRNPEAPWCPFHLRIQSLVSGDFPGRHPRNCNRNSDDIWDQVVDDARRFRLCYSGNRIRMVADSRSNLSRWSLIGIIYPRMESHDARRNPNAIK